MTKMKSRAINTRRSLILNYMKKNLIDSNRSQSFGFVKVAAVTPPLKVAHIDYNLAKIQEFAEKAEKSGPAIIVFPELCLTGYTLGDLFHQRIILTKAEEALIAMKDFSLKLRSAIIVGLPVARDGKLFNCAALVYQGKILGIVPKTYIPNYKEFYEERWFASGRDLTAKDISIDGAQIPFGTDLLFPLDDKKSAILGIEICEDLWTPVPPSSYQALNGATIIANLSASNDLIGKADYRRELVKQQSARSICGYIYASCGVHESTTDLVFGGHALIAENGSILAESKRFEREGELIISEIDIEHLLHDREKTSSFGEAIHDIPKKEFRFVAVGLKISDTERLTRFVDPHPFVPSNTQERDKRAEEIFSIQTAGLAKRMEFSEMKNLIIGVSGGLDSTLALLVAAKTCGVLGISSQNIKAFTLPGFGTTARTKSNAEELSKKLNISFEEIDITNGCLVHFKDIQQNPENQDVTYQNVQARYRTMVLMNKANQLHGLVVGTGDLSEIALGWCTFTGDQISHYNVNASVPKTLVKYLVKWASEQKDFQNVKDILDDILATPISPELIKEKDTKTITQKTESLIGPYELHDFYLYHFVRWGSSAGKILFLAQLAFGEKYSAVDIKKWLVNFIERFFNNQWKRSVMPDGPKVGSVSLSPRGDWRMPSDAEKTLWLEELL